jgi:hypothetical protein
MQQLEDEPRRYDEHSFETSTMWNPKRIDSIVCTPSFSPVSATITGDRALRFGSFADK